VKTLEEVFKKADKDGDNEVEQEEWNGFL